ncbi:MAG: M15 family metallopeptidase [Treponema sp.]|nr:M15 family metallopeptidase [Treponema sp.]
MRKKVKFLFSIFVTLFIFLSFSYGQNRSKSPYSRDLPKSPWSDQEHYFNNTSSAGSTESATNSSSAGSANGAVNASSASSRAASENPSDLPKSVKLPFPKWWEPEGLEVFKAAYPDLIFIPVFDKEINDYQIHIVKDSDTDHKKEISLYWAEGRFLPKEKLSDLSKYRKMVYPYTKYAPDPKNFTQEDIQRIKDFTSKENREKGPIDPPFLYDFIYDCKSRESLESHLVKVSFLGFSVNVHERIKKSLQRVEKRINALPESPQMKNFIENLNRIDCYNWRSVRDTENRSFHSLALAIDILPRGYYQKSIYWGWQRQWDSEFWWKTPLEKRWMPPQEVIDIFVSEGFLWGGSWIVWDNMHFEYRPEVLLFNK